jgi:nucleoside-diphosphate kinase
MERTLMIIKPDAVAKNAIGEIIRRVESEGFVVRELRMMRFAREATQEFYGVHSDKPFFPELIEWICSGAVVPMVLERADAVAQLRRFIGETDSTKAAPGTIRADFGTNIQNNAVHASDSVENAAREIGLIFGS